MKDTLRPLPVSLLLLLAIVPVLPAAEKTKTAANRVAPDFPNVKYGPHERNVLDFWQAKASGPTPLFVHIHGGGWRSGDKSNVSVSLLNYLLEQGISVASINYRYSEIARIPAPVHDAARAIQFLRSKAGEWKLDKQRVAAMGSSAGACTTLWLAYHDDLANPKSDDPVARESTRLTAGIGVSGQTSIDPEFIAGWVGDQVLEHGMISRAVGATNQAEVKARSAEFRPLYREFSPINHVTRDDPPVLLVYPTPSPLPAPDPGKAIHHAIFGTKLKEKADAVGAPCTLVFADKPNQSGVEVRDFLLKQLKK